MSLLFAHKIRPFGFNIACRVRDDCVEAEKD